MAGVDPSNGRVVDSGGEYLGVEQLAHLAASTVDAFVGIPVSPEGRARVMLAVLSTGPETWTAQLVAAGCAPDAPGRDGPLLVGAECARADASGKSGRFVAPDAFAGAWGRDGELSHARLRCEGAVTASAVAVDVRALLVADVRLDARAVSWTLDAGPEEYDEARHGSWEDASVWRLAWDPKVFGERVVVAAASPGKASRSGTQRCADGFRRRVPKKLVSSTTPNGRRGHVVFQPWSVALSTRGRWWASDDARGAEGDTTTSFRLVDAPGHAKNTGRMLAVARTYLSPSDPGTGSFVVGDGAAAPHGCADEDEEVFELDVGILNSARGCPRVEVDAPGENPVVQDLLAAFVDVATARFVAPLARGAAAWCAGHPARLAASRTSRRGPATKRPVPPSARAAARLLGVGPREKRARSS